MNQNSRPIKGREAVPVVPPLLAAGAARSTRQQCAIGSHANARVASGASNAGHIHSSGSRGNFTGFLPGGVSVYARRFTVGFGPATFLFQGLYACSPYYLQMWCSVKYGCDLAREHVICSA